MVRIILSSITLIRQSRLVYPDMNQSHFVYGNCLSSCHCWNIIYRVIIYEQTHVFEFDSAVTGSGHFDLVLLGLFRWRVLFCQTPLPEVNIDPIDLLKNRDHPWPCLLIGQKWSGHVLSSKSYISANFKGFLESGFVDPVGSNGCSDLFCDQTVTKVSNRDQSLIIIVSRLGLEPDTSLREQDCDR